MTPIDVEHISKAILEDSPYGIIVGQVVVLLKVSILIEVYGSVVGGEDMQVDGFAMILGRGGDVLLQTVQQQRPYPMFTAFLDHPQAQDVRNLCVDRKARGQNVSILFVNLCSAFYFSHYHPNNATSESGSQREELLVRSDVVIP